MAPRALAAALAFVLFVPMARADIAGDAVKIGVLTDLSGAYEQASGFGSVEAAKMAAEEFGNSVNGKRIEILAGDHQNKPDIGASVASRWFDVEHVDAITDLVDSAVAFTVVDLARHKNKTVLLTSAGSADFTGKACAPDNSVQWVYDTYEMGKGIGEALPLLGKKWFFVSADYAFGIALQKGVTDAVKAAGGEVIGSVRAPLGTSDFSSYVLQAQASKADVVAFANGGDDAVNAMKAAREFGLIAGGQKIVPLGLTSLPSIKSTSLAIAQDGLFVSPWLPTLNAKSEAFMKKFIERRKVAPGPFQVGTYSAVRAYLQAVKDTNSTDPKIVLAQMRKNPIDDAFTDHGVLRPDGRMVHDVYLTQIKKPAESKDEWDMLKLGRTIPGATAFRPLEDGECPAFAKKR